MGLDNFNVAPNNMGGRSKGSEDEEDVRRVNTAHTFQKDSEEFWEEQYATVVGMRDPEDRHIRELADKLHLLPRTIKSKLTEYGVYEYEEYVEQETSTSLQTLVHNAKQ